MRGKYDINACSDGGQGVPPHQVRHDGFTITAQLRTTKLSMLECATLVHRIFVESILSTYLICLYICDLCATLIE